MVFFVSKFILWVPLGRLGGRVLTSPINVAKDVYRPVDLGGHWISSEQYNIIKLVDSLGLTLIPQYRLGDALVDVGHKKPYVFEDHPIVGNLYTRFELKAFLTKVKNTTYLLYRCHEPLTQKKKIVY